jgi:hypothetical protein
VPTEMVTEGWQIAKNRAGTFRSIRTPEPNGRRNRLPHHGRSSSWCEVGQAVSPVGSLFSQPVTHGGSASPMRKRWVISASSIRMLTHGGSVRTLSRDRQSDRHEAISTSALYKAQTPEA